MELLGIVPLPVAAHAAAFAAVAGDVALVRTVRALLGGVPMPGVVVVAAEPLAAGARSCLDSAGLSAVLVLTAEAPGTRRQCLATATEDAGGEPHPVTHVLVHDIGHPLATTDATERVIAGLRAGHPVVVPVLPVTDTFKAVTDGGAVIGTVDRTELRTVQYPRGYERATLRELIVGDADEFAAALSAGLSIATVDGDADGFAAELPADAELMDAITSAHHPTRPGLEAGAPRSARRRRT
jgi:2-C-methyl-D-erythritol 4-phosphate cytidylyltransferase